MPRVYVEYRGADLPGLVHYNRRQTEHWLTQATLEALQGRVGGFFEADLIDNIWHIGEPENEPQSARDVLARSRKFRTPEFTDGPVREKPRHV